LPISNRTLRSILPSAALLLCAATAFAATITGTVINKTTGQPSPGDTIGIINTAQSMDEIAKVTSDASGRFQATAPDGGQILLHVTHKGAEYFKSVPPGAASVDINVYDSAAKVSGVTGEALVLRAETDATGKMLSVSENFFVQNASAPPRTQYGGNTLEFFLPKGAQIMQSLASSPGGLPTNTKVVPVDAASGRYAFTFPIRPGETRFQVAYSLPYSGKQAFSIKLSVPTGDVAVMLPKAMQFDGGAQFQPINPDPNSQSYDAHSPSATQPIVFTISGTGQLPDESPKGTTQSAGSPDQSAGQPSQAATSGPRPGGGLGAPDDPGGANDANFWTKYKFWILGIFGLALAGGAGVMLKANPATVDAVAAALPPVDITAPSAFVTRTAAAPVVIAAGSNPLLQALKDELLELETDRLTGKLTEAQYVEHKAAFDIVLRRALNRSESA
jgi:hypothetical protein